MATAKHPEQTGWFAAGTKPARPGPYGSSANNGKHPCFQHWNGSTWGKYSGTPEGATRLAGTVSAHQSPAWYGLAADPAAGS